MVLLLMGMIIWTFGKRAFIPQDFISSVIDEMPFPKVRESLILTFITSTFFSKYGVRKFP